MGKSDFAVEAGTRIMEARAASLQDVEAGGWLEARDVTSVGGTLQAASIRIGDTQPNGAGTEPRSGRSGRRRAKTPGYSGIVQSIDGNSIVIAPAEANAAAKVSISVSADTVFVKLVPATEDAILPGARVSVIGDKSDDGALIARSIEITH